MSSCGVPSHFSKWVNFLSNIFRQSSAWQKVAEEIVHRRTRNTFIIKPDRWELIRTLSTATAVRCGIGAVPGETKRSPLIPSTALAEIRQFLWKLLGEQHHNELYREAI
jgi:hypothetical protein